MAKYKRAELAEDEDSVHITDHHLKTHVIPVQPKGLWESRSQLEKFLLLSCSCMLLSLLIFTALAIHGLKSSYVVQFNPLYKGSYANSLARVTEGKHVFIAFVIILSHRPNMFDANLYQSRILYPFIHERYRGSLYGLLSGS